MSRAIRFDIVSLNSGTTAAVVRSRLETIDPAGAPVVVVRRQLIATVTWHRVGLQQLAQAVSDADDDTALSMLLALDAGNEVPAQLWGQSGASPPYGVLLLGDEPIAFSEGEIAAAAEEPRRGTSAPPAPRPAMPTAAAPPPTAAAPPEMVSDGAGHDEDVLGETFSAFPDITAPTTVRPGEEFEVKVGVSAKALAHTVSEGIAVSELDPGQQTVRLEVLVTGPFDTAVGSENVGYLDIDRDTFEHEPLAVRFTTADPPDTYDPQVGVWVARVTAAYFHEGAFVGEGYREVRVNQVGARHIDRESDRLPVAVTSPILGLVDDEVDLTISISIVEPGAQGRFQVRLFSRHLPAPVDAGTVYLGQDAKEFATRLVREVDYTIANPVADETLNTIGRLVAEKLPDEVEAALAKVWEATAGPDNEALQRRVPDVLLLTDDWAVPWELMSINLDDSSPPFLGAQVNVGRWPNQKRDALTARELGIHRLGVMVGHYQDARGVQPLPRAEEEGRSLEERYDARMVNADPNALNLLLAGSFADGYEIEGLHFAGHGESDPSKGTYLMYSDGARMGVFALGSAPVASTKNAFLFVNACQVGTADEMLGEYSGLAGLVVGAGFRGFMAPLWSVSDDIAQQISLGLYEASAEGVAVSSYLREVRGKFRQTESEPAHTTYMAYVFFGHPALRLGGPDRRRPN
ncbi:MAG TPA: CHAT domain-containing protein [Acidimicrobiia bacterium]|nr:CHAT domain-containing protein [Acidimicrobiia bacterium]